MQKSQQASKHPVEPTQFNIDRNKEIWFYEFILFLTLDIKSRYAFQILLSFRVQDQIQSPNPGNTQDLK